MKVRTTVGSFSASMDKIILSPAAAVPETARNLADDADEPDATTPLTESGTASTPVFSPKDSVAVKAVPSSRKIEISLDADSETAYFIPIS